MSRSKIFVDSGNTSEKESGSGDTATLAPALDLEISRLEKIFGKPRAREYHQIRCEYFDRCERLRTCPTVAVGARRVLKFDEMSRSHAGRISD